MSAPDDHTTSPALTPAERLAALTDDERKRIGTAMRYLADLKGLYAEGMDIGTDLLEGKAAPTAVASKLVDFEARLRSAADVMLYRSLRLAHVTAIASGETKLDYEPWLKQLRIEASQTRARLLERAREDRFRSSLSKPSPPETEEPETESGPRP